MADRIKEYYNCALNLALSELERLAVSCLRENKKLTGFCNSMGVYFFWSDKNTVRLEDLPKTQSAKDLHELYEDWDDYLKISGHPLRLEKIGDKIKLLRDW
jgi:hypothetical protein